jgi:hypothetical protein
MWKRQSVEMAAVRVSGTVTNDDQRAYIKIETLRKKKLRDPQFTDGSVWCGNC